jgi:ABC-type transport system substrate-binding protein
MPGNLMAPSLAESWTVSADQRVYEFKLREGVKFHNGDPFTAEDVKFSFQRSKVGKVLKDKVRDIEVVSPSRVRFHLTEPFPDFMAFYGTLATGAGWIVPKKYVESVGDDGFKKRPVGLGPYKFVSHTRASSWSWRRTKALAQDAGGEAPGIQDGARRHHARGHAQERRGGRGVHARRADGARAQA